MDERTLELLTDISQIIRQLAYESKSSTEQFYLHKLSDTIDNAIEESEG